MIEKIRTKQREGEKREVQDFRIRLSVLNNAVAEKKQKGKDILLTTVNTVITYYLVQQNGAEMVLR